MSEIFTPLFVTKNSSELIFLLNVAICAMIVPCAGPNPGNNPKIHPEILPANMDLLILLLKIIVLSSSCGGILDLEFKLYNKLLILNNPYNKANKPKLFPTLLVNTNNPRIPEIKNNKIFCNLFSFLLKKNNKITIVINNKYPMKFFNIL